MTDIIKDFLENHLYSHALIIAISMGAMIAAMIVDLVSGVYKARMNGEATTSQGLKKTCDKARKYFSPFIVAVCIDLIASIVIPYPIFSMIWAGWCVLCEFISVREKAWQKAEIRQQEKTISIILENKEDIAKALVEILKARGKGK